MRVAVTNDLADTAATTVAVTVRSVAPKMKAGADARVRVGARLTRACSFADPGADRWSGSVSYGDGSAKRNLRVTAARTFSLAHCYRRAHHRYTVTVTVRDDRGLTAIAHVRVRVR